MPSGIDTATGVQLGTGQPYSEHLMTNFFLPLLADARNNSTVLYNMIRKVTPTAVSGRFIIFPTRTTRNTGRGALRSGGDLSDPGSQGAVTQFLETRDYQGRIKIDGKILRQGKTNGGAFIEPVMLELEGQIDDITVDFNRMVNNDGSGRLAQNTSTKAGAVTTLVLTVNQSIEGQASLVTTKPTIYLEVGDRIGFYAPATDAMMVSGTQSGFYVVAIPASDQIQISLTAGGAALNTNTFTTLAGTEWVVRMNTEGGDKKSSGARNEMIGIAGIMSDAGVLDGNGIWTAGTSGGVAGYLQQSGGNDYTVTSTATAGFQGNAASLANSWNRAVILDNGSSGLRPISESLLQQAFSDAEELNNANIQILHSAYAPYNSYVKLLTPNKVFNDTLELKGGHKTLSFNGVPWVKDRFCYGNRVNMLNLDPFMYFEVESLQQLTYMGTTPWQQLANKDAVWMGHMQSGNLGVEVRQRVGAVLTDLAN